MKGSESKGIQNIFRRKLQKAMIHSFIEHQPPTSIPTELRENSQKKIINQSRNR